MESLDAALLPEVSRWLERRTTRADDWPVECVWPAKGSARVSVVLPARNEEATVGAIVHMIRRDLLERAGLVDEIIVVDSRSRDATASIAAAAGAAVVHQDQIGDELPGMDGKGAAMWCGLAASSGDIVVFIDADLKNFQPKFVTALLGPLLTDPGIGYVKGFYRRPLLDGNRHEPQSGGRVTELVARPLLNLFWPRLAGFIQPLAGEYAGRRELLEQVPFVSGYGVELGLLIDLLSSFGLDALAQVDLDVRIHRHQSTEALGQMASQILLTAWSRLQQQGRADPTAFPRTCLAQFRCGGPGRGTLGELVVHDTAVVQRPPLATLSRPAPLRTRGVRQ
ncbi:glucosyl-3-phosphoglycerate synthase [Streptomyces sp. UNOC14_S4]|uniref:glucosyl-3-phosphoglycerate synthase n=1 Tax=Streptomyces sp. UNOC14_S4 TaxID=2872340 RepID=UPI001E4D3D71|nr:glucosyl-3-phosphoglycerate synthase [Streptomyces sp. UNOC14_S4]